MILSDPQVMMGKPVVAGTRITVDLILEKLGSGESIDALLESHPSLTRDGVLAALRFAAKALRSEVVYPVDADKNFDAVAMMRSARDKISAEIEGMTLEEELKWFASQEVSDPFLKRLLERAAQQAKAANPPSTDRESESR
jgi:uncharacterized protein (DUF433 family)